ncbi:MAG: DUF4129 domain-containing protein [Candidatus Sumerlaeia bacterium]|nr:DUF4129 domain-containing protein [Candidatus Sumerlaeia bacterium]
MNSERPTLAHFWNPTVYLAYLWAYGFTVFATLAGLGATRLWPEQITWPIVLIGFGVLFAAVAAFRPLLIELGESLGLREKLGLFLLAGLLFVSPKLVWRQATLIDCLIVLQVPLVMSLIRREGFVRLYTINFLLAALSAFVLWQTEKGGFEVAAPLVVFFAGCFTADRWFFELDRFPQVEKRPFLRPLRLGVEYGAVALAGGTVLYLMTPRLTVVERVRAPARVVEHPGGVRTLTYDALFDLVWQTFLLLVLIVAALAVLQYLKRKYRRPEEGEDTAAGESVLRMVRRIIRPTPRPPDIPRGFSPREQILRGYWAWCDEMERFGLARLPVMTPKEFAGAVARNHPPVAAPVGRLTAIFEAAKYDRRPLAGADVEGFFACAREVIESLLVSKGTR